MMPSTPRGDPPPAIPEIDSRFPSRTARLKYILPEMSIQENRLWL